VSGGHLCGAEAPTEAAAETAMLLPHKTDLERIENKKQSVLNKKQKRG